MLASLFNPSHYVFNPYAVPMFLAAAATLLFGAAVLIYERGTRVSRLFFSMTFIGGVWLFSFSWMYCAAEKETALAWGKVGYLAVTLLPAAVFDFSMVILRIERQRRIWRGVVWFFSALFALLLLLSDAFIVDVYRYPWGYYPKAGWLSIPFLLFFFGVTFLSLLEYDAQFRNAARSVHGERTKSFLKAFGVAYLASFDFLANYGVPLYPFGYVPILVFFCMVARTIGQYRLIDMAPAIAVEEIISTISDFFIACDAEGAIQYVNEATRAALGYSERELIGKPIGFLALNAPALERSVQEAIRGTPVQDEEMRFCGKGGRTVSLRIFISKLRDRDAFPVGAVIIARDAAERNASEAAPAGGEPIDA